MSFAQPRSSTQQFPSRFLRNKRDLIVYLPPGYDAQPQRAVSRPLSPRRSKSFRWHHLLRSGHGLARGTDRRRLHQQRPCRAAHHRWHLQRRQTAPRRIHAYAQCRVSAVAAPIVTRKFLLEEVRPFVNKHYRVQQSRGKHRNRRLLARRARLSLSWPETTRNLRENRRALAFGLVERARHPALRRHRTGSTASPNLARHRHPRRPAYRRRRRTFPRHSPPQRLAARPALSTTNASKAPNTTKPPGPTASAPSSNSFSPRGSFVGPPPSEAGRFLASLDAYPISNQTHI